MTPLARLYSSVYKEDLHDFIERIADPIALEWCISFLEEETLGCWHGRARAKMARRLKHIPLNRSQRDRLVNAITRRFVSRRFSEGFKDQLRLALHLAPAEMLRLARELLNAPQDHVSRYARWLEQRAHERLA